MGQLNIQMLGSAIASDNGRALEQLYGKGHIPPAVYNWHVDREKLSHPPLQELHDAWQNHADPGALVDPESGEPRGLSAPTRRFLMVVEPEADYSAVCYRYYGEGIAEAYGKDLSGQSSSAFSGPIATFFMGAYLATAIQGTPLLTRHRPPPSVVVKHWQRLILPPVTVDYQGRERVWFLAANVPLWE